MKDPRKTKVQLVDEIKEMRQQLLVENMGDMVCRHLADSTIIYVSPSCKKLLGYRPTELLNKRSAEFVHPEDIERTMAIINNATSRHYDNYRLQHRIRHKDGRYIWVETVGRLVYGPDGSLCEIQCNVRDITERKQSEEKLRESEEKYRQLVELSPDPIVILQDGKYALTNQAFTEAFGYTKKDVEDGLSFLELVREEDKKQVIKRYKNRLHGKKQSKIYCLDLITKSNAEIPSETSAAKINYMGRPADLVIIRDITERKEAEKVRKEHLQFLESLCRIEQAIHGSTTPDQMLNAVIETVFQLFKCDRAWLLYPCDPNAPSFQIPVESFSAEYPGAKAFNLTIPTTPPMQGDMIDALASDGPVTYGSRGKKPVSRDTHKKFKVQSQMFMSVQPKTGSPWLLGIHQCSHARIWTDQEQLIFNEIGRRIGDSLSSYLYFHDLIESEAKFRGLVESSSDWIWEVNIEGVYCYASQRVEQILGYKPEEVLGKTVLDLMPPEEAERITKIFKDFTVKGESIVALENVVLHKDGRRMIFETSGIPIIDESGKVSGYRGMDRDITKRKQAELAIQFAERNYREIFNTSNEAIFVHDMGTGEIVDVNQTMSEMYGYTRDEAIKLSIGDLSQGEPPYAMDDALQWVSKAVNEGSQRFEWLAKRKSGELFWNETNLKHAIIGGQDRILAFVSDITDRKRAEEVLLKMQKLESIGTLAGGIAHDFNNILMGLFGNISMAKEEIPKDHPAFYFLEEVEKSMSRATHLTKQLLTFAKGGEPVKEDIRIGMLIDEVVHFDLSGSNIMPVFEQADDLMFAKVDRGQVQQVFSNLTINAREAMPDGGHLYFMLENADLSKNTLPNLNPGKYVKIIVRDEGAGIARKHLDRIFDPYFSTKQTGSGLGLATVYSIINKHGGYISVDSEFGKGTIFTLYLPGSESQQRPAINKPVPALLTRDQPERILVMDDDVMISKIVTRMLEKIGFSVETASDGKQAVELYKRSLEEGKPFDVLIMDNTIPGGIGGKEAIKNILAIDPDASAIVSSGYADDPVMANYAEYGFKGIVAKPYTRRELLEVLSKVLQK